MNKKMLYTCIRVIVPNQNCEIFEESPFNINVSSNFVGAVGKYKYMSSVPYYAILSRLPCGIPYDMHATESPVFCKSKGIVSDQPARNVVKDDKIRIITEDSKWL
jgi:hypothetical protein